MRGSRSWTLQGPHAHHAGVRGWQLQHCMLLKKNGAYDLACDLSDVPSDFAYDWVVKQITEIIEDHAMQQISMELHTWPEMLLQAYVVRS